MTSITVTRGDITRLTVDGVVNAANRRLVPGGGVDGAIHAAGGPAIAAATAAIIAERGPLASGEAVITTAGDLPASYVIHTVGPVWGESSAATSEALLANCYEGSLELAAAAGCRTLAFPNISTGVYGFPKRLAAETATSTVSDWVTNRPDTLSEVIFVCFDAENFDLYRSLTGG